MRLSLALTILVLGGCVVPARNAKLPAGCVRDGRTEYRCSGLEVRIAPRAVEREEIEGVEFMAQGPWGACTGTFRQGTHGEGSWSIRAQFSTGQSLECTRYPLADPLSKFPKDVWTCFALALSSTSPDAGRPAEPATTAECEALGAAFEPRVGAVGGALTFAACVEYEYPIGFVSCLIDSEPAARGACYGLPFNIPAEALVE